MGTSVKWNGREIKNQPLRAMVVAEIPADQPMTNPIQPSCDFICHLIESDLVDADNG